MSAVDKAQYRCSLINLDNSGDDELDAILGELTVLESQFQQEIVQTSETGGAGSGDDSALSPLSPGSDRSSNMTDLGIHSATHSRSSSGSDEIKQAAAGARLKTSDHRTDSPDTDSAFCDNISVLSSCSTTSSNKTGQSVGVPSTVATLSKEEQEAKIKAEKIKIAIEKIKEASVKKLFIKVFTCDGSAKSLLVDEKMTVGHVTRILAEKNHVSLDPKWALVELVPDLYMERVYEDNELLVENCLLWKVDSKNTLWFIERPEKFDLFSRPEIYLLGSSSSQKDDHMEEHSRQELLEEYFSSSGVGAPEVEGTMWLKADGKKSWKKFYFVLRTSGLYYSPKGKKTSKDLVCLTTFDVNQVYYGIGWKGKYKAPTDYCFGIKHPQIQAKNPKYIKYLCVDSQKELHQWVTGIRVAKNGRSLFDNYRGIVEEITHADIDMLTAKRFSVNSNNGLKMSQNQDKSQQQLLTPSSENKSLASALSSGIESDMSQVSRGSSDHTSAPVTCPDQLNNISVAVSEKSSGGTLERGLSLRRSFSRSSRSSSSSGCLSDKSGQFENGFESDFPAGGTIKKRPSAAARLPLTSTTWSMVRESEQDQDTVDCPSGGGTLRRKALRNNSTTKKAIETSEEIVQVHQSCQDPDPLSSAFEQSMTLSMMEEEALPLPPPPRVDSVTSLDDIDLLPPPPPDMCITANNYTAAGHRLEQSHYHVSPVSSPGHVTNKPFPVDQHVSPKLPPPSPAPKPLQNVSVTALKKTGTLPKSSRRISFDDHVQMIEAPRSTPEPPPPLPEPSQQPSEPILKYSPQPPIRNNPKKLSANENYNSLPRTFLDNLQKVMSKKWQVAEKCRQNESSPYEVLGFRDETMNTSPGQNNLYNKNSAIGAWVLETQMYSSQTPANYDHHPNHHHPQPGALHHHHPHAQHPPCYQVENAQPRGQCVHVPETEYGQYNIYARQQQQQQSMMNGHNQQQQPIYQHYQQQQQPVVLREPDPSYVDPRLLRANKMKRPPPPPRRSENTQLSNC